MDLAILVNYRFKDVCAKIILIFKFKKARKFYLCVLSYQNFEKLSFRKIAKVLIVKFQNS